MNVASRQPRFVALVSWAIVAAVLVAAARADTPRAEKSITAGREALGDGSFPWYDGQADSLQPLHFRSPPKWQPWDIGPVLNFLVWTALAVVLAAMVALLIYFARKQTGRAAAAASVAGDQVLAADQVEALPFLAARRRDDLLGQARFHYQQGNYSEAIIYLFSYELLQLDKFSVIRLAKGKTNRQYLREAARVAALRSPLERTMDSFEGVFFGRRPLDRDGFEACWNALPEFERQLRAAT